VGTLSFYFVGYAFAFGDGNGFIGYDDFMLLGDFDNFNFFVFQYAFLITSVTIVSGSMAERTNIYAYIIFAIFYTAWTYPVVAHCNGFSTPTPHRPSFTLLYLSLSPSLTPLSLSLSLSFSLSLYIYIFSPLICAIGTWTSQGWLKALGYHDLAGSSVVHCTGGMAGLVGTILLKPRLVVDPDRMRGHSTVLVALGFFFLAFGFIAFNTGSLYHASNGVSSQMGKVAVNTLCSCAGGALSVFSMRKLTTGKLSLLATINGGLAGFVAICSSADEIEPYGGIIIGAAAGLAYLLLAYVLVRFKVDDPLDAAPVHLGAGICGVIGDGFFSTTTGILYEGSGYQLGLNLMGVLVILAWSGPCSRRLLFHKTTSQVFFSLVGFWTSLLFFLLKRIGMLRVSEKAEVNGLDSYKHNENSYPEIVRLEDRLADFKDDVDRLATRVDNSERTVAEFYGEFAQLAKTVDPEYFGERK